MCPEVADRPGSHCSDENDNAHMLVRGVCCLPDTASGTSHVLSSVPSEPRTEQTRQPHCTGDEWRAQEMAVTWRGTWEAGNPSARSRQTPSPRCVRSAWEAQCSERARTPANMISQTLDFTLTPFCSKSSQPVLTERQQ